MRLAAVLIFISVVVGALYVVFSHPAQGRLEALDAELAHLKAQNESLAQENEALEEQILALRDDPRVAERRAREAVGLARPEELIFQFDEPATEQSVQVRLRVGAEHMELAGKVVEMPDLAARLAALSGEMPEMTLAVIVDDEVGPIERQRVLDIVEDSPLSPEQWAMHEGPQGP